MQNDGNLVVYDSLCTSLWATNTTRTAKVAAACSAAGSTQRVPLPAGPQVTGPFGGDGSNNFDDGSVASNGANRITKVSRSRGMGA